MMYKYFFCSRKGSGCKTTLIEYNIADTAIFGEKQYFFLILKDIYIVCHEKDTAKRKTGYAASHAG